MDEANSILMRANDQVVGKWDFMLRWEAISTQNDHHQWFIITKPVTLTAYFWPFGLLASISLSSRFPMSVTWLQMTLSSPMATMELEYHRSSKSSVWPTFVWCGRNFIILHFPMDTERPIDLYIFIYLHIYVLSKSRDFCLMWKKQLSLVSNKCRKANWSYANIVICFLNPGRPNDERSGPALSPSANEV